MQLRKIALALPLVLGVGFTQSGSAPGSQPGDTTGASPSGSGSSGSSTYGTGAAGSTSGSGTSSGDMGGGTTGSTGSEGAMGSTGTSTSRETGHVLTGRVTKVSKDSLSIKTHGGQTQTLSLAPETMVTVDGQEASASDIKKGQDVRASYSNLSGQHVATKIDAMKQGSKQGSMDTGTPSRSPQPGETSGQGSSVPGQPSGGRAVGNGG